MRNKLVQCSQKVIGVLLACMTGCLLVMRPAIASPILFTSLHTDLLASLHTYHEQLGQTTVRSRLSLRDRQDHAWQTILFKRYQNNRLEGTYLRLVGFPGLVELDPQAPIKILTGTGLQWEAMPQLDPQTAQLPNNAGQYNVQVAISALSSDIPLEIEVVLQGHHQATLVVPPYAVHEWRVLETTPAS